ncbi:hypothetical protein PcaKH35_06490 [Parageobacillus caldoxylosilyticus]|nr:hypothetical protein PcaKH35_06490 [Parageobacillus caldoxylosilyticus]
MQTIAQKYLFMGFNGMNDLAIWKERENEEKEKGYLNFGSDGAGIQFAGGLRTNIIPQKCREE